MSSPFKIGRACGTRAVRGSARAELKTGQPKVPVLACRRTRGGSSEGLTLAARRRRGAVPLSISDLPNWAEAQFVALCAADGLTANKAVIDRFGWDYLVEFDRVPLPGVAHDEQRGSATARVQIKSKRAGSPSTRVKLSNALRFTKETDPCFVVLFQASRNGLSVREFAREFDRDLMAVALRRAREAERDGEIALNRIEIAIPFLPVHERTGRLAGWIREIIESKPEDHGEIKRRLADTLGFERGGIKGVIRFPASEVRTFIDHALGLDADFKPTDVTIRRERFDIAGGTPLFTGAPDRIEIRAQPTPARLTIRGMNGMTARFAGEFRSFNLPGAGARASFLSPFVRAVLDDAGHLEVNYNHAGDSRAALQEQLALATLHLASRSTLTVILDVDGLAPLESKALDMPLEADDWFDWFATVLTALSSIPRQADHPHLSLDDLASSAENVASFVEWVSDGDAALAIMAENDTAVPSRCRNLLGYAHVTLGDSTFTAIARRPCLDQREGERGLELVFGDPVILECAARHGSASEHLPRLRHRFRELAERIGAGTVMVDDGDVAAGKGIVTMLT